MILTFLVGSTWLLGLAYVSSKLLAQQTAATRHAALVIGFLAAATLPAVLAVMPPVYQTRYVPSATATSLAATSARTSASAEQSPTPELAASASAAQTITTPSPLPTVPVIVSLWAIVAGGLLARLLVAHWRARQIVRHAAPSPTWQAILTKLPNQCHAAVRESRVVRTPMVVGLTKPVIIVPAPTARATPFAPDDMRRILRHELAHIERRDTLTQLLGQLVCYTLWMIPFAWLAKAAMLREAERAADDHVLQAGEVASAYATTLLHAQSLGTRPALVAALQATHEIENRIIDVLAPNRVRGKARMPVALVPAVLAVAIAACASRRTEQVARPAPATAASATTATATQNSVFAAQSTVGAAQTIVDQQLAAFVAEQAPVAARVIVQTLDGNVVASASMGEHGAAERTRAIVPGSTIKPLVVAAAIDAGMSPAEVFDCASITVLGKPIVDHEPHGKLSVTEIIAMSSNVGATQIGMRMPASVLHAKLQAFGIGAPLRQHIEPGWLPPVAEWTQLVAAKAAMGVGEQVSMQGLADAYTVLANHGRSPFTGTQVVAPQAADATLAMLEQVVTGPKATGAKAAIPGVKVGGKTATVQVVDANGNAVENRWHASFVGVLPLDAPKYVVVVSVEVVRDEDKPRTGGQLAAPLFAKLGAALLK